LLVLVGFLTLMILPAFARTRSDSRAFQCLNNVRELTRAWRMYCDDSQDALPYSAALDRQRYLFQYVWTTGSLDNNPANQSNWNVTRDIQVSPLWKYCGTNAGLWRCPGDQSFVVVNGVVKPRVRSMAMNMHLAGWGGTDGGWGWEKAWKFYLKATDFAPQPPAKLFVLMDMREDSIDIGNFATKMDGYSMTSPNGIFYGFNDLPGAYHDGAGTLSFADGRAEVHRWTDPRTVPPLISGGQVDDGFASPHNPDVAWLQDHSTRPK